MPHTIVRTDNSDEVCVRFSGPITMETILRASEELRPDGVFLYTRRLWDLRGCDFSLTQEELRQIGAVGRKADAVHARIAILVDSDFKFGLARLHGVYRESIDVDVDVFRSEAEAWSWLRAEG